jgi:hypothetical protein
MIRQLNKNSINLNLFRQFSNIFREILWIEKILIYKFNIEDILSNPKNKNNFKLEFDVTFRNALPEDIETMACNGKYNISYNEISYYNYISQNDNFMVLTEYNNMILSYAACIFNKKKIGSLYFILNIDECFILACFTHYDYRGMGICPKCIEKIAVQCSKKNIKNAYIDISSFNDSSTKSTLKAGGKYQDSGYYRIRFLKKDYVFPYGKLKDRFIKSNILKS